MSCRVDGEAVFIGSRDLMTDQGLEVTVAMDHAMSILQSEGQTAMLVATAAEILGMVSVADVIRPEAAATVSKVRSMCVYIHLLLRYNYTGCYLREAGPHLPYLLLLCPSVFRLL